MIYFLGYVEQLVICFECISINSASESEVYILFFERNGSSGLVKKAQRLCIRSPTPVGRLFKFGDQKIRPNA